VLERLVLADGRRLVAKRIVPGTNWIDRHTKDRGREALLFTSGVLGRMPHVIDHAVVAAERDGDAWWVVMRDVSASLLPDGKRLGREEHRRVLAAANLMWEEFWEERVPHLCPLHDCFRLFSPAIAHAERDGLDLLPKQYEAFWEAFAEAVEADVAEPVLALLADPGPLVAELEACGTTLIHADIRDEQIGLDGDRLILLDWDVPARGIPWSTSSGPSATTPGGSTPATTSWSRTSGGAVGVRVRDSGCGPRGGSSATVARTSPAALSRPISGLITPRSRDSSNARPGAHALPPPKSAGVGRISSTPLRAPSGVEPTVEPGGALKPLVSVPAAWPTDSRLAACSAIHSPRLVLASRPSFATR
jgi:hypothetical protein